MDLSDFRTNAQKEQDGVDIPFGSYATIRLRSTSNSKFMNLWSRLMKPHEAEQKKGKLSDHVGREILARCISQQLIVNWEKMYLPKFLVAKDFGNTIDIVEIPQQENWDNEMIEVPFSKQNAFTILNHPGYNEFRVWIMQQANEIGNFQDEDFEGDRGNLKAISSTKRAGENIKRN